MATASKISISPDNTGLWGIRQEESVAQKATELLQKDMENHHVFFNNEGFHNHVSHQILALFGTGASADVLTRGYVENENYQRPLMKPNDDKLIEELRDWDKAKKRLAKEQYYSDWLAFFQHEIERLGWQQTLAEYMFKGDERSQDMMVRMYAGFLHPLIQLMYGVEWNQPAIVAMALAQACVHGDELRRFLVAADAEAQSAPPTPMPRIADLLEAAAGNATLRASPRLGDSNKIRDGVLARAWDDAVRVAGRVKIRPEELAERTAEMFNTAIYEATAAALRPGKDPKYDFFLMHHVNVAPIFLTLNKQDWILTEHKVRLLEWKIRMDIVQYVARGCPTLSVDKIADYVPKDQEPKPATDLLPRMHSFVDDGHAIKLWRAVFVGKAASAPYEDRDWLRIRGGLWDQVGRIIVDAVEAPGPTWVRNAGFAEAWKDVGDAAPRL